MAAEGKEGKESICEDAASEIEGLRPTGLGYGRLRPRTRPFSSHYCVVPPM